MNILTSARRKKGWLRQIFFSIAVFLCCIIFFMKRISDLSSSTEENYRTNLRQAILRSAVHCYAIEGRYPESLAYLKEHYGLYWDETEYLVDYEIIGSNLRPDVTIIPLHQETSK